MQLIIGTYTETLDFVHGTAEGILTAPFDPATGAVGPPALAARVRNPSYLALSADGGSLYAVSETESFGEQPGGGVAAFARDPATGRLTELNSAPSAGPSPSSCRSTVAGGSCWSPTTGPTPARSACTRPARTGGWGRGPTTCRIPGPGPTPSARRARTRT